MPTAILALHGFMGHRNKNWLPWLREEAVKRDIPIVCPNLPDSDKPVVSEHLRTIDRHREVIGDSPIIVAHSLGAATALRWMEHSGVRPAKLVLVAPVASGIASVSNEKFPDEFYVYRDAPYDADALRDAPESVTIFLSRDDPYIDFDPTLAFYRDLFGEKLALREYPSAGHFNANAGYHEFPDLLPYIFSA